jgi:hypothetical protein
MTQEHGGAATNEEGARTQSYRRLLAYLILHDIEGQEAVSDGAKEFQERKKELPEATQNKTIPAHRELKPCN